MTYANYRKGLKILKQYTVLEFLRPGRPPQVHVFGVTTTEDRLALHALGWQLISTHKTYLNYVFAFYTLSPEDCKSS